MMRPILLVLAIGVLFSGCAKLPLDNGAPKAPRLTLAGTAQINNVPIEVVVDDPDSDRVTLSFTAENKSGETQEFVWTSFIDSGQAEVFTLGLGSGEWEITARAKDEWEEIGPAGSMTVSVGF
jgi:hypothetical protein